MISDTTVVEENLECGLWNNKEKLCSLQLDGSSQLCSILWNFLLLHFSVKQAGTWLFPVSLLGWRTQWQGLCVCACGINQQKPSTMRPLPETARSHPHVADGNRAFSVCFFTAKQMVTMANRLQRAKRRSLVSNSVLFELSPKQNLHVEMSSTHSLCLIRACRNLHSLKLKHTISQQMKKESGVPPVDRAC